MTKIYAGKIYISPYGSMRLTDPGFPRGEENWAESVCDVVPGNWFVYVTLNPWGQARQMELVAGEHVAKYEADFSDTDILFDISAPAFRQSRYGYFGAFNNYLYPDRGLDIRKMKMPSLLTTWQVDPNEDGAWFKVRNTSSNTNIVTVWTGTNSGGRIAYVDMQTDWRK